MAIHSGHFTLEKWNYCTCGMLGRRPKLILIPGDLRYHYSSSISVVEWGRQIINNILSETSLIKRLHGLLTTQRSFSWPSTPGPLPTK